MAKTSRVNRAATAVASSDASAYCRDLDNWPRSWMGLEKDLPPGEQLLACFRPFIEHLASSSLSAKTIRKHVDNLWMLGGEIIRDLHEDPSLRKVSRTASPQCDPRGRRPADPQRLGRRATLLRLDLPQAPRLPRRTIWTDPVVPVSVNRHSSVFAGKSYSALSGGDFQGMGVFRSDGVWGKRERHSRAPSSSR